MGIVVMLCLIPVLARHRAWQAMNQAEDRFSENIRIPQRSTRPTVTADTALSVRLHPKTRVVRKKVGEGAEMAQVVKTELAGAISARSSLKGKVALSAARRRLGLMGSAFLLLLSFISAIFGFTAYLWMLLPVAMCVALLGHGAIVSNRFNAQLAEADEEISRLRTQYRVETRARRAAAIAEEKALAAAAEEKLRVTASMISESGNVAGSQNLSQGTKSSAWVPTQLPRPVYQMRATAPRRQVELVKDPTAPHGVAVPVRPMQARRPETGALTSLEVADGASLRFDVDTVIERRRAAG
ncbi:hypothetical protein KRX54_00150 [Actinomycetaceae bacterium TAE3-ERU4]|nr:hypothetical protein [Actinomycetaceae bacterium TAE3-ERU4]